jgi:hypothetical protein
VNYLLSFSAWIAYAVVGSISSWRTGVIVALVVQALVTLSLARKRQLDLLSIGTLIFFAAMSAIALAAPHSSIHKWIPAISAGALAVIAGGSLAVGKPFTLEIAKRTTAEAVWERPEFLQVNRFLTSVWTASFCASAVACALLIDLISNHTVVVLIAQIAAFVIPMRVTQETVKRAKTRAAAHGVVV